MSESPHRILVVDDEPAIRHALRVTLSSMGFLVTEAATGEEALSLIRKGQFDAALLDMNMPGMGGMRACEEIRRASPRMAILMLTVRDSPDDKVDALEAGADDYVTKPFHMRELAARLRAALRRSTAAPSEPDDSIRNGDIVLDKDHRVVFKRGAKIRLTPKEFDLLQYLMANAGKPIPHGRLLSAIWGAEYNGETEYLRTFIHQLRKKLEDDPANPTYLLTETWYGYRFR